MEGFFFLPSTCVQLGKIYIYNTVLDDDDHFPSLSDVLRIDKNGHIACCNLLRR